MAAWTMSTHTPLSRLKEKRRATTGHAGGASVARLVGPALRGHGYRPGGAARLGMMTTVLIVEADPELRALLRLLLDLAPDVRVAGALGSVPDALAACQKALPDVLVVDGGALQRAAFTPRSLSQQVPGAGVLVLALYPSDNPDPAPAGEPFSCLAKDAPLDEIAAMIHRLAPPTPCQPNNVATEAHHLRQ